MIDIKIINCPLGCRSCYLSRIRQAQGSKPQPYNLKAILETLDREASKIPEDRLKQHAITIHGGEPLSLPIPVLEKLLEKTFQLSGYTSIQTGLVYLKKKHIELFKRYKTHVGISIDGDTRQLNGGRYDPQKTLDNMQKAHNAGLRLSIISVLRKYNASPSRISDFIGFLFEMMDKYGIIDVRTNPGIVYEPEYRDEEELTGEELGRAFLELAATCFAHPNLMWQPYRDIVDLMFGYDQATCNFNKCDPWHTRAEIPIVNDGSLGNCMKPAAAVDGIMALRADRYSDARYKILPQIPQELGGCKDCRYWAICTGGCPGEGIDNDWRNRTRFCEGWFTLFDYVERQIKGLMPNINVAPEIGVRNPEVSQANIGKVGSTWQRKHRKNVEQLTKEVKKYSENGHGDRHGDVQHGDHNDQARLGR